MSSQPKARGRRPRSPLLHAALAAALCAALSDCGGATAGHPTPTPLRAFGLRRDTRPLIDHFRSTPPNGNEIGQPDRMLTTDLWIPVPSASDPGGAPFPLVFFVHGSAGLRGQSTFLLEALARQSYNSAYSGGLDQPYR